MHTRSFSNAQAAHALTVVLNLMKQQRFFLYREGEWGHTIDDDLSHGLDPNIFGPALTLDNDIRSIYTEATHQAELTITEAEQRLGVKGPDLSDKKLVRCSRYTGGLDICRVYPGTAFTELAPATSEELVTQEIKRLMGSLTADNYSPNGLRELEDHANLNARKIWDELDALKMLEPRSLCVVLLKTRFQPNGGKEDDFMEGKLSGIQLFPHAMGYLFYEYSKRSRIVRHAHVTCSTSWNSHVNVQHWSDGKLELKFDSRGGYDCRVYFPLIL